MTRKPGDLPSPGPCAVRRNLDGTWAQSRTMWKFGMDIRKFDQRAYRDVQSRGFLNFVGFTGHSIADLLQGFLHKAGLFI